ncbi:hypothetical protein VZT92_012869 [Zoarces viviparus]|uniref:Uncharacterized protein n=1 Tax=Zoarces viviparus TaxID=48416 RepID=A0AAW1F2C1_ZOAVI
MSSPTSTICGPSTRSTAQQGPPTPRQPDFEPSPTSTPASNLTSTISSVANLMQQAAHAMSQLGSPAKSHEDLGTTGDAVRGSYNHSCDTRSGRGP